MNDNEIASEFKATIRILFVFGQIIVSIIRIWPDSKKPLFSTALAQTPQRCTIVCLCPLVVLHIKNKSAASLMVRSTSVVFAVFVCPWNMVWASRSHTMAWNTYLTGTGFAFSEIFCQFTCHVNGFVNRTRKLCQQLNKLLPIFCSLFTFTHPVSTIRNYSDV